MERRCFLSDMEAQHRNVEKYKLQRNLLNLIEAKQCKKNLGLQRHKRKRKYERIFQGKTLHAKSVKTDWSLSPYLWQTLSGFVT